MVDNNKPVKTGFEVLTEVESIVANIDGLIDALCLVDNCFSLDNETLSECEKIYLLAHDRARRQLLIDNGVRQIENFLTADERTDHYMRVLEEEKRLLCRDRE